MNALMPHRLLIDHDRSVSATSNRPGYQPTDCKHIRPFRTAKKYADASSPIRAGEAI
jgi:hypothetical protein